MKLIIGLGNPGDEYKNTRHNVGFMFLDYIKEKYNFPEFKLEKKFKAEISIGIIPLPNKGEKYKVLDGSGEKVVLVKPQTFMNLSGESVGQFINFYKLNKEDLIIISDDKDMEFGKVRFRKKGSAGGHNGLKSIIQHIGEEFKRIKIGIGSNTNYKTYDWVLSKFKKEELEKLNEIFENIILDL